MVGPGVDLARGDLECADVNGLVESIQGAVAGAEHDDGDRNRSFLVVAYPELLADDLGLDHEMEVLLPGCRTRRADRCVESIDEGEARIGRRALRVMGTSSLGDTVGP